MKNKVGNIFENIVVAAIILVLVQTFLEDLANVAGWPYAVRRAFVVIGFVFDLFFTIEFLVRSYIAIEKRNYGRYFWHERGWLDFLAAVPLLVLNSGPEVFAMVSGVTVIGVGGLGNILKVVKAVRIARILRLMRTLKIFKQIKNADSKMAQRHVGKITALTVSVMVFFLIGFSAVQNLFNIPGLDQQIIRQNDNLVEFSKDYQLDKTRELKLFKEFAGLNENLVRFIHDDFEVYSRYDDQYIKTYFGPNDLLEQKDGKVTAYFDLRPINAETSLGNLVYFGIIIFILIAYLVYYSPHFALTVSDPIHVMRRGLSEGNYNLEVRIPPRFKEDDVFRLAELYNSEYLPMKDRQQDETSALSMDNVADLFSEEY